MKRLATCFVLLIVMAWPSASAQAAPINLIGVDTVSPAGRVTSPYMHFYSQVFGADTADVCIAFPAQTCKLVTHVVFWVDLPQSLVNNPNPLVGCPAKAATCQYMGQDTESLYSLGLKYNGPPGYHRATAQAWRFVWGDTQPVFLGQDTQGFRLVP